MLVKTIRGSFKGLKEDNCYVFKGIPYAKAPEGELRFKAPVKTELTEEIIIADKFGNRSAQAVWDTPDGFYKKEFYWTVENETPISEDGLYLNIWTKEPDKEKKMPVIFYIHGGGFLGGAGHEIEFITDEYAKRDVVLVTINYRVGIFGFLAHPWLYEEDPVACGNYGVLDQIAALDWVRENIVQFGGDPENITICGQSAGGMSVETLIVSDMTAGKFQKAIIQSASGYPCYVVNNELVEDAFGLGLSAMKLAGIDSLEELRSATMDKLLEVQGRIVMEGFKSGKGIPYAPVINGFVLKEHITDAIRNGNMNRVPTIIGCTKNDMTVTDEELKAGKSRIYQSDIDYSLMCEKVINLPAYVYYFKRDLPGDDAGAFHSSELWYTFGTLDKCWRPMEEGDYELSREMLDYWSNFARSGNPNGFGLDGWLPCTEKEKFVKEFDKK